MFDHACIKCRTKYQDKDPDPYYCASCNEERLELAKKIDAQMASRPKKQHVSALQEYDNAPKIRGFIHVKL